MLHEKYCGMLGHCTLEMLDDRLSVSHWVLEQKHFIASGVGERRGNKSFSALPSQVFASLEILGETTYFLFSDLKDWVVDVKAHARVTQTWYRI